VIVAGGGAISAEATAELRALAERLGAPVVTTWNGKGAIDETHPLAGQTIGDTGSPSAMRWRRERTCC
jgi:acetolactate synthase I/II/III large subunit